MIGKQHLSLLFRVHVNNVFNFIPQKIANEREVLVSVKASEADAVVEPPLTSHLIPKTTHNERELELENKEPDNGSESGVMSLPATHIADSQQITPEDVPEDPEKIKMEEAATKAQAAFRGYLVIFSLFYS